MTKFQSEEPEKTKKYLAVPVYKDGFTFRGVIMKPARKCLVDAEKDALDYCKNVPDVNHCLVCKVISKAVPIVERVPSYTEKKSAKLVDL
jgi:hypothetical protein